MAGYQLQLHVIQPSSQTSLSDEGSAEGSGNLCVCVCV